MQTTALDRAGKTFVDITVTTTTRYPMTRHRWAVLGDLARAPYRGFCTRTLNTCRDLVRSGLAAYTEDGNGYRITDVGRSAWTVHAVTAQTRDAINQGAEAAAAAEASHHCTLPPNRFLPCGCCPHQVCKDCERCAHTCECRTGGTPAQPAGAAAGELCPNGQPRLECSESDPCEPCWQDQQPEGDVIEASMGLR
ncbi:hypothetical protein [Streptomyces sp. NBC_01304]|uniref:hypothetical protein n=1 Tax=Streptomyces sp. NBC_01304 TaxID=2903818 RepID=UPI002E121957|nr:hypothetical protein OG430_41145 [Streptomyces sp. NBC_01304]